LRQAAAAASEFGGGYMTVAQVYAWIFLAMQEQPRSLKDIVGVADAINHAIPNHRELQGALGWLVDRGLVRKEGKRYSLTEKGSALRTGCSTRTIMANAKPT
jgi:predicted transcriptional regulator